MLKTIWPFCWKHHGPHQLHAMIDIHPSVSTQNMQHRPVLKISACKLFNIQHRSQICDVAQRLKLKSKVSQRQNQNQNVNVSTNSCRLRLMSGTALSRTYRHNEQMGDTLFSVTWTICEPRPDTLSLSTQVHPQWYLQQLHSFEKDPVSFMTGQGERLMKRSCICSGNKFAKLGVFYDIFHFPPQQTSLR